MKTLLKSAVLGLLFVMSFLQVIEANGQASQTLGGSGDYTGIDQARYAASQSIVYVCHNPKQTISPPCGSSGCQGGGCKSSNPGSCAKIIVGLCDPVVSDVYSDLFINSASLIDTVSLNHHHFAEDYKVGRGSASCSSCGSGVGSGAELFNLYLERRHRYRDMTTYSSYGPGVFSNYDTKLRLYEYDGGTVAELFEPHDIAPRRFVDGIEGDTLDGELINKANNGFNELKLYDATDTPVTSLASAAKAVLTLKNGVKHTFDLFELERFAGDTNPPLLINPSSLPSGDLVAHWELDDGSGTTATDSEASYDGTITGATWVTSTAPSGGSALSFDGSGDYVDAGNVPVGSAGGPDGAFTASFWMKPGTPLSANAYLLNKSGSGLSFYVEYREASDYLHFRMNISGQIKGLNTRADAIVKDKWQHVAVSYDGRYQRVFVNGQEVARSSDFGLDFSAAISSDLRIGADNNGNNGFVGEMDDVRVYSRALTPAEIRAELQAELLASYSFEENTGTTTADGSGNGNTGTLLNGAAWTTDGFTGNAIDFDGVDDAVNLGSDPSLLSAHWITVSAWVKPDTLANAGTGDGSRTIAERGDGVFLRIKDGQYQFGRGTSNATRAEHNIPSGDLDEWVHLTGTYDGQTWSLYRNGIVVDQDGSAVGSTAADEDWVIGNSIAGDEPFDGTIDEVRIYNYPLWEDDIVQLAELPIKGGRMVEVEDRNGFTLGLTYKDQLVSTDPEYVSPAQVAASPDIQWQIDTITDAYGRDARFYYKSTQESGRWVVEKIDLPNAEDINYVYDQGKLSEVNHADGTQSTFAYGVDSLSQTTTVTYNDASAVGTHRNKTAYLSNIAVAIPDDTTGVYSQAAMMVRLVANGSGEVAFLHMPQSENNALLYTGRGKIGRKFQDHEVRYYEDGWSFVNPDDPSRGVSGSLEAKFATTNYNGNFPAKGFYRFAKDRQGLEYEYLYNTDGLARYKEYPDTSFEKWTYNGFRQIKTYEDRQGRITRNTYDADGNLTLKEVGLVNTKTYKQALPADNSGPNIEQATIANGYPSDDYAAYAYSYYDGSEGPAVAGITGAAGTQGKGLKKSDTDANGNVTHYVYDSNNFRIAMIAPADRSGDDRAITLYSYDSAGRMSTVTDPLGRVTTFAYDSRDRQKTVTYEDGSISETFYANELTGGAGNQVNLVVATKDRNDNFTQYRHDGQGRRVTTIRGITSEADALNQSFIPDTTYHDVEECVYLDGTTRKITCTRNGERVDYTYDYRHRQVATTTYPRDGGAFPFATNLIDPDGTGPLAAGDDPGQLVNTTIYRDNLRFASVDPYGRATFYYYRSADSALIRTVKETVPGGSGIDLDTGTFADVIALTRDLDFEDAATLVSTDRGGAAYLITDMIKDTEGQTTSIIDPRNIQHDTVFDSRGRTFESVAAVGTTVEAKSQTIYDAQSNVVAQRTPRYFDSGDTEGFNKAFTTMTYTGRNLLATQTVAAGDTTYDAFVTSGGTSGLGAKATQEMFYYLDGTHEKTVDFNGNDPQFTASDHETLSVWRDCCRRLRATIDQEGHGRAQGTDFNGNVAHTAVVNSLIDDVVIDGTTGARTIANSDNGGPGIWDAPDTRTLAETTTRFDSKNRPVATTVWLDPLDQVDPNDPPILYGGSVQGGTNAQAAVDASQDGLTTLYYYSEDIYETPVVSAGVEGVPTRGPSQGNTILVHQFSGAPDIDLQPMLNELANDSIEVLRDDYTNASASATINPEGEISVTIMDGLGRPVISAMLDPTNNSVVTWSTVSHDRVSDAIATTFGDTLETLSISALDHLNRSFTDGAGRTIESEDAEGEVAYAVYDNNGNAIRTRNANAVGQDCDFDARNRDISCTDTQGDTVTRTYNDNNQVLTVTDAKGVANKADTVYDARGRAIETTSRLAIADTNEATYDPNSNLLTQTDAEGGTTTYEYDPRNLRMAKLMPGHNTSSVVGDSDYDRAEMTYDAMRRLLLKTDQQGDTCVYTYDLASRLLTRDYRTAANSTPLTDGLPTGTIADTDTFTYDDASRPLTAIKGRYSNTVAFAYDNIGRPVSEALTTNGVTYTTGYTNYDDDSRLTVLTYPDGSTVTTSFTDRNQAEDIDYTPSGGSSTTIATMSYDAGMRHTSSALGNGLTPTYAYRGTTTTAGDNMLDSITVTGKAGLTLDYTYDANKNMTAEDTGGVMEDYGVDLVQDAKDRMTSWTRDTTNTALDSQSWNLSFESDWDDSTLTDGGTGTTQTRTHNAPHELLTIDPDGAGGLPAFNQTHDAKGNLTADGDGLAHTFDFDNMLKQVVVAGASPRGIEGTHTYTYDALGRRVSKSVDTDSDNIPDVTTVFVCARQQVIAEYIGGTTSTDTECKYIFCSTGYIDEPIAMIDASGSGEETYYYHRNRLFSIIGLTDDTGVVIERYAYTAYGEVTVLDANAAADADNISDVLNSYTYTGRRLDNESGLLYFRARYHDPVLGRFLERDPLGYPDGLNTYAAYHVMYGGTDPMGLNSRRACCGGVWKTIKQERWGTWVCCGTSKKGDWRQKHKNAKIHPCDCTPQRIKEHKQLLQACKDGAEEEIGMQLKAAMDVYQATLKAIDRDLKKHEKDCRNMFDKNSWYYEAAVFACSKPVWAAAGLQKATALTVFETMQAGLAGALTIAWSECEEQFPCAKYP